MLAMQRIYDWVLALAGRRKADAWLLGISFSEAIFFPIPPDVMLIPMGLAQPRRVWRLAAWCTVASVVGGLVGYSLGWLGSTAVSEWLAVSRWAETYEQVKTLFADHGVWILLLAGFTPIPFKVFTITAGLLLLPLHLFVLAGVLGRGSRFFLVAALLAIGGEQLAERIRSWVSKLGWVMIAIVAIILIWYFLLK